MAASSQEALLRVIKDTISDSTSRIERRIEDQQRQIEELSKPQHSPAMLYANRYSGQSIHSGESGLSSRGYSFLRAAGYMAGVCEAENCKTELGMHERLSLALKGQPMAAGAVRDRGSSMMCPLGSEYLREFDSSLATECREIVQAAVANLDPEEYQHVLQQHTIGAIKQDLSQSDLTAGGSFFPPAMRGELIELIRAKEIFSRAGATQIAIPPQGQVNFPKQTGASESFWIGESVTITEDTGLASGDLTLIAKRLGTLIRIPNNFFRFTSPSFEMIAREDIAQSQARKLDLTMMTAAGSAVSPKGIANWNIQSTRPAITSDSAGDTITPAAFGTLRALLSEGNFDPDEEPTFAFILSPTLLENILDKRTDAVASADAAGPFLFSANRQEIERGGVARIRGGRALTSSAVPRDRTSVDGSTTNLSFLLAGVFRHWLIMRGATIELSLSREGDGFAKDESLIRGITFADAGPRHENAFAVMDGIVQTV